MVIQHLREDRQKEQRREMDGEETTGGRGDFYTERWRLNWRLMTKTARECKVKQIFRTDDGII